RRCSAPCRDHYPTLPGRTGRKPDVSGRSKMKFARSMFVRVSIIPLVLAAGPVASSATQVEVLGTIPAVASQPVQAAIALPTPPIATIARDQLIAEAADLNAGHYVWHPELAPSGAVEIVVSLPQQRAYIYRANTLI